MPLCPSILSSGVLYARALTRKGFPSRVRPIWILSQGMPSTSWTTLRCRRRLISALFRSATWTYLQRTKKHAFSKSPCCSSNAGRFKFTGSKGRCVGWPSKSFRLAYDQKNNLKSFFVQSQPKSVRGPVPSHSVLHFLPSLISVVKKSSG
jgi:hypothetical protein